MHAPAGSITRRVVTGQNFPGGLKNATEETSLCVFQSAGEKRGDFSQFFSL
jgi:hypothetical protein